MLSPVRHLSVTFVMFVHLTQPVEIFGDLSTPFNRYLRHPLTFAEILRRSSQGNPSAGGLSSRGVAKYSDFGPIEGYSEMVQDKRQVSINH